MSLELNLSTVQPTLDVMQILSDIIYVATTEIIIDGTLNCGNRRATNEGSMDIALQVETGNLPTDTEQLYAIASGLLEVSGIHRIAGLSVDSWDKLDEAGYMFPDVIRSDKPV